MADTIYSNGATNGNTDGWTINFGFAVSDTFNVAADNTQITGFTFASWMIPGDTLQSAELSITSSEFGGTSYFDQVLNFTQSNCEGNSYGYNVCQEDTGAFAGPTLNSGTYWIGLDNAISAEGQPVYWDENSAPTSASVYSIGTIPSESFTVLGNKLVGPAEPSSILLFGSGILGLAGVLRRKLF